MPARNFSTFTKALAVVGAAIFLASSVPAFAQESPYGEPPPQQPPVQQPPLQQPPQHLPTYAVPTPTYSLGGAIKGMVTGFDGQWIVYMRDDRGFDDHITLHQGTQINPTGIRLLEGMRVAIWGYADGPTYQANRIDVTNAPQAYYGYGGYPFYGYGYGGYPYGYGYGGYPYGYGYGYPYGWGWPWGLGLGLGINWGWGWGYGWHPWSGYRPYGYYHPWGGWGYHGGVSGRPWR